MSDRSFVAVSVYPGDGTLVSCCKYPDEAPILSLLGPELTVTVSCDSSSGGVTCHDVDFALALVREVQEFADETTRIHQAQDHPDSPCTCASAEASAQPEAAKPA